MNSGDIIGNIVVIVVLAVVIFVAVSLARAVRIVPQSQAYVVERLGRFQYFRGPSSPRRALLGRRLALCTRVAMAVADRYLRARGHRSPQAPAPRALRTGQKIVPMIVENGTEDGPHDRAQ